MINSKIKHICMYCFVNIIQKCIIWEIKCKMEKLQKEKKILREYDTNVSILSSV